MDEKGKVGRRVSLPPSHDRHELRALLTAIHAGHHRDGSCQYLRSVEMAPEGKCAENADGGEREQDEQEKTSRRGATA